MFEDCQLVLKSDEDLGVHPFYFNSANYINLDEFAGTHSIGAGGGVYLFFGIVLPLLSILKDAGGQPISFACKQAAENMHALKVGSAMSSSLAISVDTSPFIQNKPNTMAVMHDQDLSATHSLILVEDVHEMSRVSSYGSVSADLKTSRPWLHTSVMLEDGVADHWSAIEHALDRTYEPEPVGEFSLAL